LDCTSTTGPYPRHDYGLIDAVGDRKSPAKAVSSEQPVILGAQWNLEQAM